MANKTPLERLKEATDDLDQIDLMDVIHGATDDDDLAACINDGGKETQLRFLLQTLGEEEALRWISQDW